MKALSLIPGVVHGGSTFAFAWALCRDLETKASSVAQTIMMELYTMKSRSEILGAQVEHLCLFPLVRPSAVHAAGASPGVRLVRGRLFLCGRAGRGF